MFKIGLSSKPESESSISILKVEAQNAPIITDSTFQLGLPANCVKWSESIFALPNSRQEGSSVCNESGKDPVTGKDELYLTEVETILQALEIFEWRHAQEKSICDALLKLVAPSYAVEQQISDYYSSIYADGIYSENETPISLWNFEDITSY